MFTSFSHCCYFLDGKWPEELSMIRLVVIIARKIRSHKLTVVIELKEESSVGLRFDTELCVASVEMQQEFRCVIMIVRSSLMNLYVKNKNG